MHVRRKQSGRLVSPLLKMWTIHSVSDFYFVFYFVDELNDCRVKHILGFYLIEWIGGLYK
jgi:hypothetical protein